jgi:hypothetical protein
MGKRAKKTELTEDHVEKLCECMDSVEAHIECNCDEMSELKAVIEQQSKTLKKLTAQVKKCTDAMVLMQTALCAGITLTDSVIHEIQCATCQLCEPHAGHADASQPLLPVAQPLLPVALTEATDSSSHRQQ